MRNRKVHPLKAKDIHLHVSSLPERVVYRETAARASNMRQVAEVVKLRLSSHRNRRDWEDPMSGL
jgi:hypothetical protein